MKSDRPKTLETYYPMHQYKNINDVPKNRNIDFALYFKDFLYKKKYKMLDFGCATGNFLANDPENIIGIDINMNLLKIARKRGFDVLCADVEDNLCFKDNIFDAVHASHVIEHLNNPILFLKGCHKILNEGGLLIAITEDFSKAYKIFYDDPTHKTPLTKNSLEKCAFEAGFRNIRVESQCVPTGMGLLVKKNILSLNKAILLSRILYGFLVYKHKYGTLVLIAEK